MDNKELEKRITTLETLVGQLVMSQIPALKGSLDDVQTERVIEAILTGTPATNALLRDISVSVSVPYSIALTGNAETIAGTLTGTGTITVLNYPSRLKIDTWKGQRLAIPVYEASDILYK